jgi:hypothetical protein
MIESRCGIECSKCDYKDQMNCLGCVSIEKPFWDQKVGCPIKNCCESKEMEHCGYCSNFPCELLKSFAYDKEQGDDGKRIKKCQEWCKG